MNGAWCGGGIHAAVVSGEPKGLDVVRDDLPDRCLSPSVAGDGRPLRRNVPGDARDYVVGVRGILRVDLALVVAVVLRVLSPLGLGRVPLLLLGRLAVPVVDVGVVSVLRQIAAAGGEVVVGGAGAKCDVEDPGHAITVNSRGNL